MRRPRAIGAPCAHPPFGARRAAALLLAGWLGGCDGIQSALAPAGPTALAIARLGWVLFGGAAIIFVVVIALTLYAVFARSKPGWLRSGGLIVVGGLVVPIVTLTVLTNYVAFGGWVRDGGDAPLRIDVVGRMWWWQVGYRDGPDGAPVALANEIHVPTGRAVELSVTSADVIHSFWVPTLAGKIDMIPGRVNRITFEAAEPGIYRGQCAEFCGAQHARMAFYVVVETPAAFEAWLARQAAPAPPPTLPELARGQAAFIRAGCGACHTIRGTQAAGERGPDLTHVGSRVSLAAGVLPNSIGNLAGWIADAQDIKPGNLMPSFNLLDGAELRAIAGYLESLE